MKLELPVNSRSPMDVAFDLSFSMLALNSSAARSSRSPAAIRRRTIPIFIHDEFGNEGSCMKIEIVVLDGKCAAGNQENWTAEEIQY